MYKKYGKCNLRAQIFKSEVLFLTLKEVLVSRRIDIVKKFY